VIELAEDVQGTLKASEISRDKIEDARNVLKLGDSVEAKIINVDRKNRVIGLSIKSKDVQEEKEAIKALKEETEAAPATTIGDLDQGPDGTEVTRRTKRGPRPRFRFRPAAVRPAPPALDVCPDLAYYLDCLLFAIKTAG